MRKRCMAFLLVLCVCMGTIYGIPAARAANDYVYVISNTLKVFKSASATSRCLATMAYGERMTRVSSNGSWVRVKSDAGIVGYCDSAGLATGDPNSMNILVTVGTANAPVYKRPDAATAVWMKLPKGTRLTAVAMTRDNKWVRLKNGKLYAYIQAKNLTAIAPTPSPTAAPAGKAYVTQNLLQLRKSPSDSAKLLATLGYGEAVTVLASSGAWVQLKSAAGMTGFCRAAGLNSKNPNTLTLKVTTNAAAPIYRVPDVNSKIWMTLKQGERYDAVAVTPDGEWVRVRNGKYFAYILASRVNLPGTTPAPAATPTPQSKTVYVATNTLKVYASASASSKLLAKLGYGEGATLMSKNGSWAWLQLANGTKGYCDAGSLSVNDPNTYAQTVYINADNAPVYKLPADGLAVWAKLRKGESFHAVAVTADGAWFRLKNGKLYGYIQKQYVSTHAPEQERRVYVSVTSLPVYADATDKSRLLGTMYLGQSVGCIGTADGWAKLRNANGDTGYCLISGLTNQDPNTLNKPYYAGAKGAKLYEKPLKGARVVQSVALNGSLMVVCLSPDKLWARVALRDGNYAYALMSELSEKQSDDGTIIADVDPPVKLFVVPTTLKVYAGAKTTSRLLGMLSFGQAVQCTGKSSTWARVVNDAGTVGYCDLSALAKKDPNAYAVALYAQTAGVKLYREADTTSAVDATLALNAQVTGLCYNEARDWYRVKYGTLTGYVQAVFFGATPVQDTGSGGAAGKVIALAKQQLGVPYVYTGQSPKGFDCSGLTYYVFRNAAGITLKRTAHSQGYDESYRKISNKAELKAGDLLFFNTVSDGDDDLCDHVGIYLGGNQFIHASSGGGKVMISNLGTNSSSYYFRTYSWARRVL